MYSKIQSKKDEQKLVYAEKKPSLQNEDDTVVETTVMKYDLEQLKQLAIQTVMGAVIISVMYYKWGYLRPLLLQSILGPKALVGNPLIQIHILGKEAMVILLIGSFEASLEATKSIWRWQWTNRIDSKRSQKGRKEEDCR